jgi:nucleoside-diphosphate-sugar epimerase
MKVLVTGASGQTGRLVLKKLEEDSRYEPKALVRTEQSAKSLIKRVPLERIIISDISSKTFEEDLPSGLDGLDAMIICTSAVPRVSQRSLVKAMLLAPWNLVRRKKAIDFRNLQFKWKYNGYPELVDYYGQQKQINLAKKLGMKHVVLISSMGVTDPDHFLNNVGKSQDGSGNGDILVWKRKAEQYLVEVSKTSTSHGRMECLVIGGLIMRSCFLFLLLLLLICTYRVD